MPLPKPTGTDDRYFTVGMLPAPLSIPCEIAPDFAKFKEVTATNTTLLADMLTEFQLALVAAEKVVPSPSIPLWYLMFLLSS